jgi:hypothetical protein
MDSLPGNLKGIATLAISDAKQLQGRLQVLHQAHHAFSVAPILQKKTDNLDSERLYHNLYQDIIAQQEFWFDKVFSSNMPIHFTEWTVGILGTLATIRRQREDLKGCLEVMPLYTRVITTYQTHVYSTAGTAGDKECCRVLTYKYNLIGINANSQAGNKDASVKHFRDAVTFEIEEGYDWDAQNFAFLIAPFAGGENHMTMQVLKKVTDTQIWSKLSVNAQSKCGLASGTLDIKLLICDGCGQEEEMHGDFLCCGACKKKDKKASYCSKDCQKKHWKQIHKNDCKKKRVAAKWTTIRSSRWPTF